MQSLGLRKSWSRRTALRTGYAAVIGVLAVSAFEAYRIQVTFSAQHQEVYRRYVEKDDALATLRRNVWLAGNYVRDFFIQNTPAQAQQLKEQLAGLQAEDEAALHRLETLSLTEGVIPQLRKSLDDLWSIVDPLPESMLNSTADQQFAFVQQQIVPRRGQLYSALRDLSAADQQRVQDSENEFSRLRREAIARLLMMIALSLLLASMVALLSLRHSESLEKRAERNLREMEATRGELQQLSGRLLEIEEDWRRKLSRELHDEIGQALALLQIEITRGAQGDSSGQSNEHLERARTLAQTTVQSVRDISLLLRPSLLDDLGLVPALQFQLEHFERRSGMSCEFVEEDVAESLPDVVNTCVYRVVQEALHNAEKHSGASRIRVSVQQSADSLTATVEDNGRGFEWQGRANNRGLGLIGIRERATLAGGTVSIDTSPGRGTRVKLRIPLAYGATTGKMPEHHEVHV
jgi:signal transduction histidine kinase